MPILRQNGDIMKEFFEVRDEDGLHKCVMIHSEKEGVLWEIIVYEEVINENWCKYFNKQCQYTCEEALFCNVEDRLDSYLDCNYYSTQKKSV